MTAYTIHILTIRSNLDNSRISFYFFNQKDSELALECYKNGTETYNFHVLTTPLASKAHQQAIRDTNELRLRLGWE